MIQEEAVFQRSERLLGADGMRRLRSSVGIVFGLGGVGSWCAEALVRTGIRSLTLVDSDRICATNINRQIQATCSTVGQVKVEALKTRLLDINPHAHITALQMVYDDDSADRFDFASFDFVIDAIDSLDSKVLLLHRASQSRCAVYSAFGAALKTDPSRIRTAEFHAVKGCPLGRLVRKRMRRTDRLPAKPITVVFSDEVLPNAGAPVGCGTGACLCPRGTDAPGDPLLAQHEWCSRKSVINGSLAPITGIFGLTLAGHVIRDICARPQDIARIA